MRKHAPLAEADAFARTVVGAGAALVIDVAAEPLPLLAQPAVGRRVPLVAGVEIGHPILEPVAIVARGDERAGAGIEPVARVAVALAVTAEHHRRAVLER